MYHIICIICIIFIYHMYHIYISMYHMYHIEWYLNAIEKYIKYTVEKIDLPTPTPTPVKDCFFYLPTPAYPHPHTPSWKLAFFRPLKKEKGKIRDPSTYPTEGKHHNRKPTKGGCGGRRPPLLLYTVSFCPRG
jgi:hypothetical protein